MFGLCSTLVWMLAWQEGQIVIWGSGPYVGTTNTGAEGCGGGGGMFVPVEKKKTEYQLIINLYYDFYYCFRTYSLN